MIEIFKIIGALGLILIAIGIILKNRRRQDAMYIVGGICLEIYSIYINDLIFIVLQLIFTIAAVYDFIKQQFLNGKHARGGKKN